MTYTVLLLLILSAVGHASWNAISRRVSNRDAFFTLITIIAIAIYIPLAVYLGCKYHIPLAALGWVLGSAIFQVIYFITLAKAYRVAPLISVYPVARGTSPLLASLFSIVISQIPVNALACSGIALIVCGIFFINQTGFNIINLRATFFNPGVIWAFLTGACTAMYTIFDAQGAQVVSGILFAYMVYIGTAIGKIIVDRKLTPGVSYIALFKQFPTASIIGGFLIFGVNATVLYCLQTTPVAYVSAVREVGIVFTALIGIIWFKEKLGIVKWGSIFAILTGIILIKIG
ncbi:EamA family transporter [Alicyclobacillus fodiniaquatilis]|uniref:EamA family transporter n=1 Tax=Alicyclobacillus fodiniaquatilis TaxID=1661150 RepID=A0ABW4JEB0_9BACL